MLVGMSCKVGNQTNRSSHDFKYEFGVIASEPFIYADEVMVLILDDTGLIRRADTDYLFDIETGE